MLADDRKGVNVKKMLCVVLVLAAMALAGGCSEFNPMKSAPAIEIGR